MAETKKTSTKKTQKKEDPAVETAQITEAKAEATAVETKEPEKTFTETEVKAMLSDLKKEMMEEFAKTQPAVVQVAKEEYVSLLYVGAISQGTVVNMGPLGRFTRAGAMIDVRKKEFLNGQTMVVSKLLEKRHVIVVDGLTDDERARYGLDYKEGEVLTKKAFERLLQFSEDELFAVFTRLCDQHKGIVCKIFISEYFEKNNPDVTLGKVKKLNNATKHINEEGLLRPILKDMGDKIGE